MRAHAERHRLGTDVAHGVGDRETGPVDGVADARGQRDRPARLRRDDGHQRDGVVGTLADLVDHVPQQAVDGVARGGLGEGELLLTAVPLPFPVRGAVGPRHEHRAHPAGGAGVLGERLDEVPVAVGQGPQPGAHLRDDRVDVACADLELLAGGKHVSTLDPL